MASEIAENLRLQKLKDAENEISQENLVKPSELLAQQRRNRKSPPKEIAKPTQNRSEPTVPSPTQNNQNEKTESSIEKLANESNAVETPSPSPPPQEEPESLPVEPPPNQPEIEIQKSEPEIPETEPEISKSQPEIPKSEPEIPSSNEVHPVTKDNPDKEVENNSSPPEVINEQSPAVIKSTKNESQIDFENSSQSNMTSSIQGKTNIGGSPILMLVTDVLLQTNGLFTSHQHRIDSTSIVSKIKCQQHYINTILR